MEGKTLFLKFNTGPSGHGMGPAAGEALALKHAGADEVKVFVFEGEGGLTPGGAHEARHTAWGLGLNNLVFMIDWNDFGIDERPLSAVVYGTPDDWFSSYGWRVTGTEHGSEWDDVTRATLEAARGDNPGKTPSVAWFKTRKGRGYGKYDNKSHGTPWPMNAPDYWAVRKEFMTKYGVTYDGVDEPAPDDPNEREAQARANFGVALSVLRTNTDLTDWLTDRLNEVAATVPEHVEGMNLNDDGRRVQGRAAVRCRIRIRPRFGRSLATSSPTARRTGHGARSSMPSPRRSTAARCSWAHPPTWPIRPTSPASARTLATCRATAGTSATRISAGTVLPTQITEFGNAGLVVGMATVNMADDPFNDFNGFWGTCSTYGSFSYLKYGPMRLFSQLAQDTRAEGREGALAGRPCRPRDGRGLAHPLRHLRDARDPALPGRSRDRSASLGVQRSPRRSRRCAADGRSNRRAPRDASCNRAAGSRGARHAVALRGRPGRVRDA